MKTTRKWRNRRNTKKTKIDNWIRKLGNWREGKTLLLLICSHSFPFFWTLYNSSSPLSPFSNEMRFGRVIKCASVFSKFPLIWIDYIDIYPHIPTARPSLSVVDPSTSFYTHVLLLMRLLLNQFRNSSFSISCWCLHCIALIFYACVWSLSSSYTYTFNGLSVSILALPQHTLSQQIRVSVPQFKSSHLPPQSVHQDKCQ